MDDFVFNFGGDETNEEESPESSQWESGRNATVFLIDVSPAMFAKKSELNDSDENCSTHFADAMKCVHSSICRQVVSSDQDLNAVVLFNTRNSNGLSQLPSSSNTALATTFPHVAVLLALDRPNADRILSIESYMNAGLGKITDEFGGVCEDASVSDALWACSNLITQCKNRLAGQNVLLFTCRDSPHSPTASHLSRQAICKARDLDDAGIDIELLPLGSNFDTSKFYESLLTLDGDAPERSLRGLNNSNSRLQQLQERVRRLEHKQRVTGRTSFLIAPGLEISVGFYTSISKARKPSKLKLHRSANELVKTVTKEYKEDTGELLMKSDFTKYIIYGGRKLKFTLDEAREMSKVFPAGIELLGFKPSSAIKATYYLKPANFIYPDDKNIKGSAVAFSALLERCLARSVVPIVRVVPRANSAVAWAALLPQKEVIDEEGYQVRAPGFHVYYLPFADDFKWVEVTPGRPRASTEQVDAAKAFIKKLHFRYDPSSFENPDIQTHWRNVEALALNRPSLEPVVDYTVPNYERIRKKTGDLVTAFKESVWSADYDPVGAAAARPKPKPKAPVTVAAAASVEDMARENKVDKLTVAALKEWLTARGVKVSGKRKGELVEDVYHALQA